MNLHYVKKISGAAAAVLLVTNPVRAEIDLNSNFSVSGYIVGSVDYLDTGDGNTTSADLDATKFIASIKQMPVAGTVSFFAAGTDDVSILDAYFSYDLGGGTTITAGKFLSYHGYEAFDIPNMLQITYSNENSEAIIPGYHKGVKLDYASGNSKMGIAALDSVYDSDGEVSDGYGIEAYYTYSADALTAYLGLAYDKMDVDDGEGDTGTDDSTLIDLWLQYGAGSTTFAGEAAYKTTKREFDSDVDSYFISGLVEFALNEKSALVLRACYGDDDYDFYGSQNFLKGTLAARQKVSDNFTVVEEISYTDFEFADSKTFLGVQGRFTF